VLYRSIKRRFSHYLPGRHSGHFQVSVGHNIVQHHHFGHMGVVGTSLLLWPDVLTFNVCPAGCNVVDVYIAKVSNNGCGAFVELESKKDVELALSRSGQCVNTTYSNLYGRVLGMFSSSLSVS